MLTAGAVLKKTRKEKGYSLEDVATATKVQKHYLEALEKDDYERFPSSVYTKGFLQNYARFLQIDPERVLALYRRSVDEKPQEPVKLTAKKPEKPKFVITPTIVIVSVISLVVLITLGYLFYQFYSFQQPPELTVTAPDGNITVEEEELDIEGNTEPDMFLTVNDEPVKLEQDGSFAISLTLTEGSNVVVIRARHPDNIGKEAVITRTIEYSPPEETSTDEDTPESPEESSEEPQPEPEQIQAEIVITTEASWIQVEADGEQVYASIAEAGSTLSYTATESIYIVTGKVSATTVTINGTSYEFYIGDGGVASIYCEIENGQINCQQPS